MSSPVTINSLARTKVWENVDRAVSK